MSSLFTDSFCWPPLVATATTETSVDPAKILAGPGDATTPVGVQARLAAQLAPHVKVRVLVDPRTPEQEAVFKAEVDLLDCSGCSNISYHPVKHCMVTSTSFWYVLLSSTPPHARRATSSTHSSRLSDAGWCVLPDDVPIHGFRRRVDAGHWPDMDAEGWGQPRRDDGQAGILPQLRHHLGPFLTD